MIEILGWASTRAVARQFLEVCNIATWNAEQQVMVPHKDIQLHPFRITESIGVVKVPAVMDGTTVITPAVMVPGFHFNLRIFGDLEESLTNEDPEDESPWNRLRLKNYIDGKVGTPGTVCTKDPAEPWLPAGYQWTVGAKQIRLYEGALIGARENVWQ